MFIPFDSSKIYHKSPFGAIPQGDEICFHIVLPKEMCTRYAYLVIHRDNGEAKTVQMSFDKDDWNNTEWWKCTFAPSVTGLFLYKFRLVTDYGDRYITCGEGKTGIISDMGTEFFFTCYDRYFVTPDSLKGSVIYQIFPDRFRFSGEEKPDVDNKGILRDDWGEKPDWNPDDDGAITDYDFFKGDLKGTEQKLDYIKSLGVGYIYLNPVFEAVSNHRYDTADYEKIDPLLGNEKDFRHLCREAEKRDIKIILDGVFSHTGAHSRYFNKDGAYGRGGAYNDKNSPYYSWYKFTDYPDKYACWWGVDILPEVDETNDNYIEYIGKVLEKWLRAGASGWRLDVADELPDKFLDFLRKKVKSINPDAPIIGEVWEDASIKSSYGERRRYLQGAQLDSVMNYPFADALIQFAVTGVAEGFNRKILDICENYPKCVVDCLMNHIGTHDTCRIINRLGTLDGYESGHINRYDGTMTEEETVRGKKLLKLVSTMQFTLPGVPSIYYGDEAGLTGGVDPFNRGCYPWGREDKDLVEHYKKLGKLRKEHPVFAGGDFVPVSSVMGCVCYERTDKNEKIIMVANRNSHPIDYILPEDDFKIILGNEIKGKMLHLEGFEAAVAVK